MLYLEPGKEALFFKDFKQILDHKRDRPSEKTKSAKPKKLKETPQKKTISFSYKDKFELEHIEENILTAESEVELLNEKIQDPDIINNMEKMETVCSQLKTAQETVQSLYDRWEILEQKKSDAQQD